MNPKYPVYIISKSRWDSRLTVKALEQINCPYNIVIEPHEYNQYSSVVPKKNILVLPFSNLGQGSIPARNWVWNHAIESGAKRHWILDDNIRRFYRLHLNKKYVFQDASCFSIIESFVDRYINIPMCGMNYELLAPAKNKCKPITWNTRIYSCILLSNETNLRWRGRYNEDTDLSLRFLKRAQCTALFNAFLCDKVATMTMKGGNTDQLYKSDSHFDGRLEMAKSLKQQHPDVVRITRKFGRWQHHVDYRPFRNNQLIRKPSTEIKNISNNFGMKLIDKTNHCKQ
jgi:hypothetical protein